MINVLGAHIFAGGFTAGLLDSGVNVVAHFEHDSLYGAYLSRLNFPNIPVIPNKEWGKHIHEKRVFGEKIDAIVGNPPCKTFSMNGKRSPNWMQDPVLEYHRSMIELVPKIMPKMLFWESVPRAATVGMPLIESFAKDLEPHGYDLTIIPHDAKDFGISQRRPRIFIVFHRIPLVQAPVPKQNVIVRKTLLDYLEFRSRYTNIPSKLNELDYRPFAHDDEVQGYLYPHILPGKAARHAWSEMNPKQDSWEYNKLGKIRGRPGFSKYRRLKLDEIGSTISGCPVLHPTENRCLTLGEMSWMCGFNLTRWTWGNLKVSLAQLMARGVMPPVGKWVGDTIIESVNSASTTAALF